MINKLFMYAHLKDIYLCTYVYTYLILLLKRQHLFGSNCIWWLCKVKWPWLWLIHICFTWVHWGHKHTIKAIFSLGPDLLFMQTIFGLSVIVHRNANSSVNKHQQCGGVCIFVNRNVCAGTLHILYFIACWLSLFIFLLL